MMLSKLVIVEIVAFGVALIFGVLWLLDPSANYEPVVALSGLLGTVLADLVRRSRSDKSGEGSRGLADPYRIEAAARYIVEDSDVAPEDVWKVLTRPFKERHKSWHPSYGDFKPVAYDTEGRPREFEVVGTAGGRYPWRIDEWNHSDKVLKVWIGPSKNPPDNKKNSFLGLDLEFEIQPGAGTTLVDVLYRERWSKMPWPTEELCFENGPHREVHWIFRRFPFRGRIDYVRVLDAGSP